MRFFILIPFLFSFLRAQNHLVDFKLKGEIKNLESTTYFFSDNTKTTTTGFLDSKYYNAIELNFDKNGNLILRKNYLDYRGKLGLFDKTIYQYNSNNQIEKQETTLFQNGEEPRKTSQRKIFYYLQNQLIRTDEFNFGRTSDQYWVMNLQYEKGKISEKIFWMEDKIFSTEIIGYNSHNQIETSQTIHNDGKKGKKMTFQYGENKLIENIITELPYEKTTETFNYNQKEQIGYSVKNKNEEIELRETYNDQGFLSKVEKFNPNNKLFSTFVFEYLFDNQNNWTACVVFEEEKPKFKIIRKIEYH